ncbi:hypothetical protein B0J13DRAFT_108152 [Dactylonectria estremocensis]|uniref:Zn(2)-C6 fungal-type domain-containing protein n=1 Tax=Dactylonectria estremocensis TaxID=1079267 RepID=A0A9P9ITE9_9HYPO|nr:hypothetical protein B0J13DRAFT_108152 [Dactylonectria estremocensis]
MKRTVGPLDKRKRVIRCMPCAKRRIKCEGGLPCKYCVRTRKECLPQPPAPSEIKFVVLEQTQQSVQTAPLTRQMHTPDDTLYLNYFASFLQRCELTREFATTTSDLLPLIQACPPLQGVTRAIGALEASRRGSVCSVAGRQSAQHVAFKSYGDSMRALRPLLQLTGAVYREDVLWSTFLLGIFELLSETSGERWVQHMLHGTSRMFQLSGLTAQPSRLSEKLFAAFRALEATRAIIYGNGTFLSQENWIQRQSVFPSHQADSTEMSLKLSLKVSSFSKRLFEQVEAIPVQLRPGHPVISALAAEGTSVQRRLSSWYNTAVIHMDHKDPHARLAIINCHALQLYLSQNFTYYSCWEKDAAPSLTEHQIDICITTILDLSSVLLDASNIPGLLLLFPLRMAGANAATVLQRNIVLQLLTRVFQKGFIVSQRISIDLLEYWKYRNLGVL